MNGMATPRRKPVHKGKPVPDTHKPSRLVRIAEAVASALEDCAAEDFNTLTDQVRAACVEYLRSRGKLPRPTSTAD